MTTRILTAAALLGLAGPALAQNATTTTTTVPAPAPAAPQPAPAPAAAPPPSGASQQVVVNPPAQTAPQAAPAQPPAPAATVQVNPPPATAPATVNVNPGTPAVTSYPQATYPQSSVVVEEHRRPRSPMAIILTDGLYGGGAGALVGLGVGLVEQGSYARDVLIGTGVGLLAGTVVGGIHAYSNSTGNDLGLRQASNARDGLGTLAHDRAMRRPIHEVAGWTFHY